MTPDPIGIQVAWISAISALAGAVIGGLIVVGGDLFLRRSERKQLARQLARGLAGEIAALVAIAERRQYVDLFRSAAQSAEVAHLSAAVTRNYFKVFDVNANQLGLLRDDLPELVTGFYVRATALAEDFNAISDPAFIGTVADDERRRYYGAMAELLDETMTLGRQAVTRLKA